MGFLGFEGFRVVRVCRVLGTLGFLGVLGDPFTGGLCREILSRSPEEVGFIGFGGKVL